MSHKRSIDSNLAWFILLHTKQDMSLTDEYDVTSKTSVVQNKEYPRIQGRMT